MPKPEEKKTEEKTDEKDKPNHAPIVVVDGQPVRDGSGRVQRVDDGSGKPPAQQHFERMQDIASRNTTLERSSVMASGKVGVRRARRGRSAPGA